MLTERVIGLKLKGLRESNNITQQYLAKKLGVSRQAVCMWESGKRELRATMLSKIARLFDVSVDHILNPKYEKKGKEGRYGYKDRLCYKQRHNAEDNI